MPARRSQGYGLRWFVTRGGFVGHVLSDRGLDGTEGMSGEGQANHLGADSGARSELPERMHGRCDRRSEFTARKGAWGGREGSSGGDSHAGADGGGVEVRAGPEVNDVGAGIVRVSFRPL